MKNKLKVIIAGQTNSGKTTIMSLINECLINNGFIVELENTDPVQNEVSLDRGWSWLERINAVKTKTKIILSEVNVGPEPKFNNDKKKD